MKKVFCAVFFLLMLFAMPSCEVIGPQKCTTLEEANVERQLTREEKRQLDESRKNHYKSQTRNTRKMMRKSPHQHKKSYF